MVASIHTCIYLYKVIEKHTSQTEVRSDTVTGVDVRNKSFSLIKKKKTLIRHVYCINCLSLVYIYRLTVYTCLPTPSMIMPYDSLTENQAANQSHNQTTIIIAGSEIINDCPNKQHSLKKV